MKLFDYPNYRLPLYATTSPDVGNQQVPSPTTTSQDVRDQDNSIECESCYPEALPVVSSVPFHVTFFVDHDYVPIKIPNIENII